MSDLLEVLRADLVEQTNAYRPMVAKLVMLRGRVKAHRVMLLALQRELRRRGINVELPRGADPHP